MSEEDKHKYELTIDLNALNHLGLNLYSNIPSVLAEIIANAWDADADKVEITTSNEEIRITDDGCGMTANELNKKFLTVGHQRRKNIGGDLTPKYKRQVMGRKGIGKLSIFSIANDIEIHTKKDGELVGIKMDVKNIIQKIEDKKRYFPEEVDSTSVQSETGTVIILRDIKKRVQSSIDNNLKKRIARRFDIFSDKFKVEINGKTVKIQDRDYFHKLEFATRYGDEYKDNLKNIDEQKLHNRTDKAQSLKISGWIGLVKESGALQEGEDNLNKISILSRGKVALEDVLDLYRDGGLYTKYLIGEIRADFLDETSKEDIATSSRQNFIQDDKRFIGLKNFIEAELKYIQKERAKYKEEDGAKKAQEIPEIKEWFNNLQGDTENAAKKLFGKINSISTDENHRKTLYKHGVLAFESLRHRERLRELDELEVESLEVAVRLFSELDDIEASWYYQITEGRLETISKLEKYIGKDDLEKVIQQHIYEHLWLLDPAWDRATEMPSMENSIKDKLGELNLTEEEKRSRFDIKYKKISGKNIIIELKRNSITPKIGALTDQVEKYRSAVIKELRAHDEAGSVEVVCLVGSGLAGWNNLEKRQRDEQVLEIQNIKVVTYQQLIKDAENSYKAYLDRRQDKGRIQKLLNAIEKF
jgi:hypothetical protein